MIRFDWLSRSEEETERFGRALGQAVAPPVWIGLTGPLGAGKTRLAAGVAHGLGYLGRVRSPTFVLENRYRGRAPLRHLDLYRLEAPDEELVASWDEDDRSVILVEWAERAAERPRRTIEITLDPLGDQERWIRLRWDPRLDLIGDLRLESLARSHGVEA
ncbi:MAG: tRNA (adenosine(37)-N6)-threonylcarbamoyltransferase complex ATPase subunit type 1 TsaE [Candidatus Eisenbacteria bacterium]